MKNLIIIHLESISKLSYIMFKDEFPALNRLSKKSVFFENFFSSASSTLMTLGDLFYGNSFEMDNLAFLSGKELSGRTKNLYEILSDKGYNVNALCYKTKQEDVERGIDIWPQNIKKDFASTDLEELKNKIDQEMNNEPFAFYLWNLISHVAHCDSITDDSQNFIEKYRKACKESDNLIEYTLNLLEKRGILEDTVIVAFGDHGDEYWTHGFNRGYIHILEPYTNLIWTPMMIYSSNLVPEKNYKPASTVDIKKTCLSLLGVKSLDNFEYCGIDLFKDENKVVYSQNLLANQSYHPTLPLRKAYSVLNSYYNLIVTADGLEMYAYRLDPTNHCNLLNFFELDKKGFIHFKKPQKTSGHFDAIFVKTDKNIKDIQKNFYELRALLKERVRIKNDLVSAKRKSLLSLKSFEKINRTDRSKFFCPKIKLNIYKTAKLTEQKLRDIRKRFLGK